MGIHSFFNGLVFLQSVLGVQRSTSKPMSCPGWDFRHVQKDAVPGHFSNMEFLEITSLFSWGLQTDSLLAWVKEEGGTPRAIHKWCPRGTELPCHSAHGEWAPKWGKISLFHQTARTGVEGKMQYTWQPPVRKAASSFILFSMQGLHAVHVVKWGLKMSEKDENYGLLSPGPVL